MEYMAAMLLVCLVVFMVLVAAIWIVFYYYYKSRGHVANDLSTSERAELNEMIEVANRMAARIETLESILDVESPGWREHQAEARATDNEG